MNQLLKLRQTVQAESLGLPCQVDRFLGGGGQGEVYEALLGGKRVALKWYFPPQATTEQRIALSVLVNKGAPNDRFLWPLDLVSSPSLSGFGYIMTLREARYKSIVDLMKRRTEPSFRALVTACLGLSHNFLELHSQGWCYRDISFGNVFFDPANGDILICDNDNVAVDGKAQGGILGTPRFIAPEVVRGEALPSIQTDLFSLSVLLFYMLIVHHPLEGQKEADIKCFDLPAMNKIYGTEPVFIFDPANITNRPVKGYHDNALAYWPIYPQALRDLFTTAFTDGIRDPQNGRVRESQWRAALVRLRDSIFYCARCGAENFYDVEIIKSSGGAPGRCWACHSELRLPYRLRVGQQVVMLNHDTQLYPHHIDDARLYDFSAPVAVIVRHPTDPNIWGLKNQSSDKWVATTVDGTVTDVEPGRSLALKVGTKMNFGNSQGEVRI